MIKNLVRGGLIIVAGSLIGSVASYFNNTLTGRLLGPELYGGFTSLISLLSIVSVPTSAVQMVAAKASADYLAREKIGKVKKLVIVLHQRLWGVGLSVALITALFSPLIARFLKIESTSTVLILSVVLTVALLLPINRGTIQGMQKFFQLSLSTSIEAIFRLLIGISLILAGLSLNGAITGVVAGSVLAYILSFLPIRSIFSSQAEDIDKKQIVNYSVPTIFVILCLTALVNADIVLAKHYLTPIEASYYAALSTIAKIIFYFSGPVAGVMFPMIANLYTKGVRHYHLLLTTLIMVFGASLAILAVFTIAPKMTVGLLYGARFVSIWPLLPSMGLVMLIYGLVNVMANYFLSIRQMKFVPYLVFFTVAEIVAIVFFHTNIHQFVLILLISQIVLLSVLLALYLFSKWSIIAAWIEEGDLKRIRN